MSPGGIFAFRFVQYNPTTLERSYKHELLTEHDLGVNIDLINPDTYRIDPFGERNHTYIPVLFEII